MEKTSTQLTVKEHLERDLVIPKEQRGPVWRVSQITKLIEDITRAYELGDPYFLGNLFIYVNKEGEVELFDGLQRYLTLRYFLDALDHSITVGDIRWQDSLYAEAFSVVTNGEPAFDNQYIKAISLFKHTTSKLAKKAEVDTSELVEWLGSNVWLGETVFQTRKEALSAYYNSHKGLKPNVKHCFVAAASVVSRKDNKSIEQLNRELDFLEPRIPPKSFMRAVSLLTKPGKSNFRSEFDDLTESLRSDKSLIHNLTKYINLWKKSKLHPVRHGTNAGEFVAAFLFIESKERDMGNTKKRAKLKRRLEKLCILNKEARNLHNKFYKVFSDYLLEKIDFDSFLSAVDILVMAKR